MEKVEGRSFYVSSAEHKWQCMLIAAALYVLSANHLERNRHMYSGDIGEMHNAQ